MLDEQVDDHQNDVEAEEELVSSPLVPVSRQTSVFSPRDWMYRVLILQMLCICFLSDFFLAQQFFLPTATLLRHLVDNGAHGAIAFCSWGIFLCCSHDSTIPLTSSSSSSSSSSLLPILQTESSCSSHCLDRFHAWQAFLRSCLFTGLLASLLDLDHFFAAHALNLSKATHLQRRPFGHSITFILIVVLIQSLLSRWKEDRPWKRIHQSCRFLIAFLSHQLRDGMRLGLWFWPIGSTRPLFYILYIGLEIGLPMGLARWQITADPEIVQGEKEKEEACVEELN